VKLQIFAAAVATVVWSPGRSFWAGVGGECALASRDQLVSGSVL